MPTRSKKTGTPGTKKTGKSPAARKTIRHKTKTGSRHKAKTGSSLDTFGIDPPIIIDGGGLSSAVGGSLSTTDNTYVILKSAAPLVPQAADGDYPYVYQINVDIKWMDWHGSGHKKDKSKNGKVFTLELHDTDEPQ